MNILDLHKLFLNSSGIVIDTRKIIANSIFIAIKGDNYDANMFAQEALDKGAIYVVLDNPSSYIDNRTIMVKNSLETLQELSKIHRRFLKLPIIALTGSNGKTTTKELINAVLSKKYTTTATIGNLNNHIGVPLTLLSFTSKTEIGIVEMGANHQKEIEFLCNLAQPDFGYITNFGKAHLEGFGGYEGVIVGKSELYTYLILHEKSVFVNLDDPIQDEKTKAITRICFSQINKDADVFIDKSISNPLVSVFFNDLEINSNLIGLYNVTNIIAAITIGKYFEISDQAIKGAIESYVPANNRSQLLKKGTNEVILDAYNANPSSMKVALENFMHLTTTNKIAILGDMFELGNESIFEHKLVVKSLIDHLNIKCIFIGTYFNECKIEKPNFEFFVNFDAFTKYFASLKLQNNTILIKGSRGMALERILNFF